MPRRVAVHCRGHLTECRAQSLLVWRSAAKMNNAYLSFLSDYGASSDFVGVCHAVAYGIAPEIQIIDLTHTIAAHNVRQAAFVLERSMRYLPAGVHVGIVDPGVGGPRRPIAVRAGRRTFVGPDNGLLIWALKSCGGAELAVVLDQERFWLAPRSKTFDGRDIFLPVAAHLALGALLEEVGSLVEIDSLLELQPPVLRQIDAHSLQVEVIGVDVFGNVQTSATLESIEALGMAVGMSLKMASHAPSVRAPYLDSFGAIEPGEALFLIDSDGYLSFCRNTERADALLALSAGDLVFIERV